MSRGVVVIGRNEGDRLARCLTGLIRQAERIVYVDSGSTDGSVDVARSLGVMVAELDTATPFTAARARNLGAACLLAEGPVDLIQFVDGDCMVEPGWLAEGAAFLNANPQAGLVTGWRTEVDPGASIYNAMAEVEWHRPAGPILSCGGDMLVRTDVFQQIGGFQGHIICSEDEDFVIRLRKAGWQADRLPRIMTRHDAAMTRFGQWWRRTLRAGHGFAEVGRLHPAHFVAERRRAWVFAAVVPGVSVLMLLGGGGTVALLPLFAWLASFLRTTRGLARKGLHRQQAAQFAAFYTLAKVPHLIGMLTFHLRRLRGAQMRLIEYK